MDTFTLADITSALKNNEFFLEYLPTIDLDSRRCVGAEALIRWRRGTEVVLPERFVPMVENTPVSGPLTYWVVDTVGKEMGAWLRAHDDIHLSINVPPEILGRGGLEYAARNAGLTDVFDKLVLEVSERGVPDKLALDGLKGAIGIGVLVALDDVGVSNANLVLLSRVNVDIVKIDKSFCDQMLAADWSPKRINGLTALMRAADLVVIVEGVESARQADILKEAGIRLVQGWHFSPSLPAHEFMKYFREHQN